MTYALIDANAMYASCEQIFRPDWRNKPIAVLSNNDGTVVACNRLAKEAGTKKFKPLFEQPVLQSDGTKGSKGVIFLSSNYELYADISGRFHETVGRFAPEQYVYSIDESFLNFKSCRKAIPDLRDHCLTMRRTVWRECRLPVSVGVGETLTLAKVGSHFAKQTADWSGVCVIETDKQRRELLSKLPVNEVWNIGRKLTTHLKHMGITTALQLADTDPDKMRKSFSVEMERTIRELNGQVARSWDHNEVSKQQIFSTRSMGERITDVDSLQQAIAKHACIASQKAREQRSIAGVMIVFASTSAYDKGEQYYQKSLIKFEHPTADADKVTAAATQAARQIYKRGIRFYKVGVGLIDLVSSKYEQQDLFNVKPNNHALMTVLDGINSRYGRDTLFLGAQGIEQKWAMKRNRLTPQYTTRWADLPRLSC
ncbi:Y-family DNA polymerase [Vibrio sp. Makdt]|uniref:Y-family DNA polymerase n=1 Tax=Vibrio sp. Makdt TaxID=2998828 RepID=UPI0022CD7541|nr:Y-family DNA polymerase [Vibrio sp. Makdt]MDA0152239.1 Y-family DNA polymerase [Vibrio sp. Makdt]